MSETGENPSNEQRLPEGPIIEAQRGIPFQLFPPENPIQFTHYNANHKIEAINKKNSPDILPPRIHIQGIDGYFEPLLTGDVLFSRPGEVKSILSNGGKIIITSSQGPIVVDEDPRTEADDRIDRKDHTELAGWEFPEQITNKDNINIELTFPKLKVSYRSQDLLDPEEGFEGNFNTTLRDEDGEQIEILVIPNDEEMLRKIQVTID